MAPADDDDGFARRADPSDDLLHIVVPDDLRELDAEVAAYRRELEAARRQERRRRRWHRVTPKWAHRFAPTGARNGLPSPVFTALLIVIATAGLLLSVLAPVANRESPQALATVPLASPKEPVGAVNGLLPDIVLHAANDADVPIRTIRPAIFVLLPPGCDCGKLVTKIVEQANEERPNIYVVLVSAGTDDTAFRLADSRDAGAAWPVPFRDADGRLAKVFGAGGAQPTLLLVSDDGRVVTAPIAFGEQTRLESTLLQLRN